MILLTVVGIFITNMTVVRKFIFILLLLLVMWLTKVGVTMYVENDDDAFSQSYSCMNGDVSEKAFKFKGFKA